MRVPTLKPREVVGALKKIGFEEIRQTGSHLILANKSNRKVASVPMHSKDIKRGLLMAIIKDAGLTKKEFVELL